MPETDNADVLWRVKEIARYLNTSGLSPLIVAELAYAPKTEITRSLSEDLRRSRLYTEQIFGLTA